MDKVCRKERNVCEIINKCKSISLIYYCGCKAKNGPSITEDNLWGNNKTMLSAFNIRLKFVSHQKLHS